MKISSTSNSNSQNISQFSTCNEKSPQNVSECDIIKPKFEKKNPENQMIKQKSTLCLLNSKGIPSNGSDPNQLQSLKKNEFAKRQPIFKYHIFFLSKHLETVFEISICLSNLIQVKEAILNSVNSFNEKFIKDKIPIHLKEEEICFELYLSKKNGSAKKDLPPLDFFQTLSMTHIKIFTLCETNDDVVTDLRKSSKISSLDSQESNSNTFSTKNNLPIQDSLVNKSPSMVIASNSYSNSLLELKCKKDIELGLFENCQKQMFCGVWKCFGKNNQKKQNLNCNS